MSVEMLFVRSTAARDTELRDDGFHESHRDLVFAATKKFDYTS